MRQLVTTMSRVLKSDSHAREDAKRLKQILSVTPDELCRRQNKCKC